ncbi:MAG: RnfABCDGE type electron transport complex subunit D [Candidatus Dormibacterales bacterium]
MLARVTAWLDRAAFQPTSLPDDLVTGIALAPCVIAGLIIFKFPALEMLAVAVGIGGAVQIAVAWLWRRRGTASPASPLMAALVGVALIGVGAGLPMSFGIAAIAVAAEILRARFLPGIRAQTGLLTYAAVSLITRGAPAAYINPADGKRFGDPIDTWYRFFSPGSAPVDAIRLYVGNVPGPVFATSLLAVVVGVAWLAYARRVSLVVLVTFLIGALVAPFLLHWDYLFQLDSGPTWFLAGLVLSDRRLLPDSWAVRPVLGFVAGVLSIALRRAGHGIAATFLVIAAVQGLIALIGIAVLATNIGLERLRRARRLRQRAENLKVVKSLPHGG